MFEQFYDDDEDQVRGLIAYGLYKAAKREWVQRTPKVGRASMAAELQAYHETWTPANIASKRAEAEQVLRACSEEIIAQERPRIVEEALRGHFWRAVVTNVASAFIYTLILIGIVIVLKVAGVDVLSIAGAARSP